jgi:two-component system, NtrC family, sensor kinase
MRSDRQSAIRLLQSMMVASLVLPAVLFAFASWLSYRHEHAVADDRIERSLDIIQEHALKVFQTGERAIAEVEEVIRGMPDDAMSAQRMRLHERLKQIVDEVPQFQAIVVTDRAGRVLAASSLLSDTSNASVADRAYFQTLAAGAEGTVVSETMMPRWGGLTTPFFTLSRRRLSTDNAFNGIISVAIQPRYFEEFYGLIGHSTSDLYALVRADGTFLARYPPRTTGGPLEPSTALRVSIARGVQRALYTVPRSQSDSVARRLGYRKLSDFPVYVVSGTAASAIRAEWLSTMSSHLIFGLPATLLLFTIIGVALQRTRKLYVEADRREAAEDALRQAQHLKAIGQLTGGVAHDFNNLLMIISGSVQRLRRELVSDKHARLLDMIANATSRGESLTRQLLTFSRRQMLTPAVIELSERLPELKDMLSRSLRDDISITVSTPQQGCAIKVDPSELELALLNLAVNARDAMPSGGVLSITAKPVLLKGKAVEEGLRGEFVAIRVADSGSGIPPDALPHVFEPFFTTKDVGKGTGLGLSQVYGFAKQSGGTATVSSKVGRGTIITLLLPRSHEAPVRSAAPSEPAVVGKPAGTVLLVEDNAEVAEVTAAYFEQLGYQVKQAANAHAALELLASEPAIDLVFSDILMPGGMTGLELGRAVGERYPALPVLLATGYSASAREAVAQGFIVLQKPFDLADLERSLREAQRWKPAVAPVQRAAG